MQINILRRISSKERAFFTRQVATMLKSGLTLVKAMQTLESQLTNDFFKEVLTKIIKLVEEGQTFSSAIARFPRQFDRVYVSVVKAGEASGKLDKVLEELAKREEEENRFNDSVRAALVYPVFIIIAMIIIGIIMLVKVLPQLKTLFTDANVNLPWSTRVFMGIADVTANWWWAIILMILLGGLVIYYYSRTSAGQYTFDEMKIRVPVVKDLIKGIYMTRFTRTFGLLIESGVPINDAISIVAITIDNRIYENIIMGAKKDLERGVPFSVPLSKHKEFPSLVPQMVAVGEQTGKMDEVLTTLADFYENETSTRFKEVGSLIEPILIIIVGLGVALMVFAILVPIYQIANITT